MKKLVLLGVICGLIASCSTKTCNTEDFRRAYMERSVDTCVKDHPKQSKSEAYDYCECVLSKFTDEMSVDELLKYGQDDPKTEEKASKLLNKYSKQCKQKAK